MTWRPTPSEFLVTARRLVGDSWEDVQVKDLVPGDIFRSVNAEGVLIHPGTHEPDDECVAKATDYPVKNINNCHGSLLGEQGYGVPIEFYSSMDELKRKGLS